ncbi:hypothetical protein QBC40DRAFT_236950 [Triangularia verruculosa]|uniref:ABC toxin N-terminal domain-containing protein n=1 Tax=Triangularia verruculosa TaxID=2587418 RepID=A0AAN6X7R2_9PEZI|nr:hypothetical protein QBC40DRAFT_236950 [Triangularia verruculosa]
MSQEDFAAITGETYWAGWFADLLQGLSKTGVKVQSVVEWNAAQLWGYSDSTAMVDVSSEKGLSCIRELMKRSELDLQDIMDLVKTQTFNRDLVIVNKDGYAEHTNSIDDMGLLANESKPLTENLCWRLQSFIRLKTKLGWSIKDLDAAIYCLRNLEIRQIATSEKPTIPEESNFTITPLVIKSLAAIVKLSSLVDIEPVALLPLWGPIDSFGEKSFLYSRLRAPGIDKLLTVVQRQEDNTAYPTLDETKMAICAALKWPAQHFPALREAAGPGDGTTLLNVETLSVLYRHALIYQVLSISPSDYPRFFKIFFASNNNAEDTAPFDRPETTLTIIEEWRKLFDAGWTLDSICSVFDTAGDQRNIVIYRILRLDLEELQLLKFNLAATPTLSELVLLQQYSELRESCEQTDGQSSLVSLIKWLARTNVADIPEVACRISDATGWDRQRLEEILRCKYEGGSEQNQKIMMANLQRLKVILDLQAIMTVDSRLRRAAAGARNQEFSPPISTLMSLAQPCLTLNGHRPTDSTVIRSLRAQLTPTLASDINDYMMAKRHAVLVAFLLQQDYITKQGITNIDGLLQYLLLDGQMGPQVQTTRIKHATTAAQQFIQRCLLGRESEVTATAISREDWGWRLEYSRWEAHIKHSLPFNTS